MPKYLVTVRVLRSVDVDVEVEAEDEQSAKWASNDPAYHAACEESWDDAITESTVPLVVALVEEV